MRNVMLDLETMGTGYNAAIVSIGAVEFSVEEGVTSEFYSRITLESSVIEGGEIDPSTVIWWMSQGDGTRKEIVGAQTSIRNALVRFKDWIGLDNGSRKVQVWGNGAAFDNVILRTAYERAKIGTPWDFWNDRCYRTVAAMYPEEPLVYNGDKHNAIVDAEAQANYLIKLIKRGALPIL